MKKIATTISVISLLCLSACASINDSYAPDGRRAYALNCSGTARGWDKCLSAAGNICGFKGYTILDKSSEEAASVGAGSDWLVASKSNERSMLIACKK